MYESRLAITMRRLVQIHEIHVDRLPRQITIELRMEMGNRLASDIKPAIHIFDGENVCIHRITPAQLAELFASRHTARMACGVVTTCLNTTVPGKHRRRSIRRRPCARFLRDLTERLSAIQMLASRDVPVSSGRNLNHVRRFPTASRISKRSFITFDSDALESRMPKAS